VKIRYDAEVDALAIEFRDVSPAYSRDIEEGVTVDLDAAGTSSAWRSWTRGRGSARTR
jgi:uncharacterized protein YuzE